MVTDKLKSTENIFLRLNDTTIKIYLEFLDYILPYFNDLNREMQSETSKIHLLYRTISDTTKTLLDTFLKPDYLSRIATLDKIQYKCPHNYKSLENIYLGGRVATSLNLPLLPEVEKSTIRKNCLWFLIEAVDQIYKRFDFRRKDFQLMGILLYYYLKI